MATLNQIADEVINALERPFDSMFHARVKVIFRHEAATIIRQELNKTGVTDHFSTQFTTGITVVDDSSIPCSTGTNVFRTDKVAMPIRYSSDEMFTSVGNVSGTIVYIYTKFHELPYVDRQEAYWNHPARYIYKNGYIYLYNTGFNTTGDITSVTDYSATVAGTVLVTSADHKLVTGSTIVIANTTNYNGSFTITVVDRDTFYITDTYVIDETAGDWQLTASGNECISISGAFNIGDVVDYSPEERLSGTVFDDDTTIILPEDIIQGIKLRLISGELSVIDDKNKIIPTHIDNN